MQEADDIIENLLAEVASLGEKPSGKIEEACQRVSCVEEVARARWQHMLAELNTHCKISVSTSLECGLCLNLGAECEVGTVGRREDGLATAARD